MLSISCSVFILWQRKIILGKLQWYAPSEILVSFAYEVRSGQRSPVSHQVSLVLYVRIICCGLHDLLYM